MKWPGTQNSSAVKLHMRIIHTNGVFYNIIIAKYGHQRTSKTLKKGKGRGGGEKKKDWKTK